MIYCVEDDNSIRDLEVYTLIQSGFAAEGIENGTHLFNTLQSDFDSSAGKTQLIILDIMLPGEDGISILKKLKSSEKFSTIPVIMATAKGSEFDKVTGLDLGADDYLAKPFGMMEMVSRVRAVLRRSYPNGEKGEKAANRIITAGDISIDTENYTVKAKGEIVYLTLKEYTLLRLMMENPGRVFTRDKLLEIVWGMDYVGETRTVDVHIGNLRTKLGESADIIETVRGVGYKLRG